MVERREVLKASYSKVQSAKGLQTLRKEDFASRAMWKVRYYTEAKAVRFSSLGLKFYNYD